LLGKTYAGKKNLAAYLVSKHEVESLLTLIYGVFHMCSARRGRIYLPLDELAQAGLSEKDIFQGKVTDKWRTFMKGQIERARLFFDGAEKGIAELNSASRWPV